MAPTFPILAIPGYEAIMQDLMAAALEVLNRDSDDDDYITDMLPAVPKHVVPYIPAISHQNASPKKLEEYSITLPEVPVDPPSLVCLPAGEINEKAAGASEAGTPESTTECDLPDELAARREKKIQLTDAILELRLECLKMTRTWDTYLPRVDINSEAARETIDYAMAMRCGTVKESPVAYYTAQLKKQVDIVNVQAAKDHGRHAINRQQPGAKPTTKLLNNTGICVEVMKALEKAQDATAIYDPDKEPLESDARLAETIKTYEAYQKAKGQLAGLQAALQAIDDIS
ncbi:hypothetical protein [Endozoicomonas sp. YOMI1]|uniref:hypothetical protein n=1 Tax=Endozoicomonas sp. YOMI1 TaxID=2828739 RepID=UPI0021474596|nr:hypothetical protein [Endozoicomonas sp. YOMI1]